MKRKKLFCGVLVSIVVVNFMPIHLYAGDNSIIKVGDTLVLGFVGTPGNVNSEPENYKLIQISKEIDYEKDTDGDQLPDWFEKKIGTNLNNVDTDGDNLPDGYEFIELWTNPLKIDTDDNGTCDADEDFDNDGLNNMQEYTLNTQPCFEDTDGDECVTCC